MKLIDKLTILQNKHFSDWIKTRQIVEDEISAKNGTFCFCGRLATGLHESHCQKFIKKVNSETVKRLEHLFKGNHE